MPSIAMQYHFQYQDTVDFSIVILHYELNVEKL